MRCKCISKWNGTYSLRRSSTPLCVSTSTLSLLLAVLASLWPSLPGWGVRCLGGTSLRGRCPLKLPSPPAVWLPGSDITSGRLPLTFPVRGSRSRLPLAARLASRQGALSSCGFEPPSGDAAGAARQGFDLAVASLGLELLEQATEACILHLTSNRLHTQP